MARLAAGVRRLEDGTLEKHFSVNGRAYSVTGEDSAELIAREQNLRQRLQEEEGSRRDMTLDQYFAVWIIRKEPENKEVTCYRYQKQYRANLSPYMGHRRISDISTADVFALQQQLVARLHPKTVNYLIRLLRAILDDAVTEALLPVNPAGAIRALRYTPASVEKSGHHALTREEQVLFMKEARDNYFYEFFALLLLTGMRYGEAAALIWSDIDWAQNVIHVTRSVTSNRDGHLIYGPAKTRSGIRDIPMNRKIREILSMQAQKLVTSAGIPASEATDPQRRIFCSPLGNVVHNRTANLNLQRILRQLQSRGTPIRPFTIHALRDTFATRFIEQGGSPQTLKVLLGHSRLSVTMDLYSQVLPNTRQEEMDRIDIAI